MYTNPFNIGFIFLAGAATGVLGAVLGTGGGVFLVPGLVLGLGVPMHYAIATSIVSVIATSSAVASFNVENGTANMPLGMTLEVATTTGAIVGGAAAGWFSARALQIVFALVMVPTALSMWHGRTQKPAPDGGGPPRDQDQNQNQNQDQGENPAQDQDRACGGPSAGGLGACYFDEALGRHVAYRVERLWEGLGISLIAGGLSGLLGIGGGVFKVPALHLICGVPIKAAAATSNFMIGVTAAASAFLYYGRGELREALTAAVVLGVLLGGLVGARLNRYIQGRVVGKLFAVLLLGAAAQMVWRACAGGTS